MNTKTMAMAVLGAPMGVGAGGRAQRMADSKWQIADGKWETEGTLTGQGEPTKHATKDATKGVAKAAVLVAKYVVLRVDGQEVPIVFPFGMTHRDAVPAGMRVVSAGFYQWLNRVRVWGGSESLGVGSREEDGELIGRLLMPG